MQYTFDEFKTIHSDIKKWHTFWLKDSNIPEITEWCKNNCIGDFSIKIAANRKPPNNYTLLVSERKDRIKINKEFKKLW